MCVLGVERVCVCVCLNASLFLAVIGVAPVAALPACFWIWLSRSFVLGVVVLFVQFLTDMHASVLFWQVPKDPSCHESLVVGGQHSCPGHHQAVCQVNACEHSTMQSPNVLWSVACLSVCACLHKHAVSVAVLWRPAADQLCGGRIAAVSAAKPCIRCLLSCWC